MKFGKQLQESVYPPWKDHYIDYSKLQTLLREEDFEDDDVPWTEDDENRFCDEIFNVQLEKVAKFQEARVNDLKVRIDAAFEKLKELAPAEGDKVGEITAGRLRELGAELDNLTNEVRQLKKFSNINYTGFLKIVKKHDRKRGDRYKVRPMMQMSLSRRPFNSEQAYVPLLNKLSMMYFAIRQQTDDEPTRPLDLDNQGETLHGERYTAHKFWVHADNLVEVKAFIVRRLPSLVYSSHTPQMDAREDPALTSLYFDNSKFDLFNEKVERQTGVSSLRLRWFGQLSSKPDIFVEQKTLDGSSTVKEKRFTIKDKYVKPFLDGEYRMEKTVQKMERSAGEEEIDEYKQTVLEIQKFIRDKRLSPVLRATYLRSAFQKPDDDRVRISIDNELAFIREDTLDPSRPCRDPNEWHRTDIDGSNMTYPFKNINQSEVSRFPHAVLEIKIREDENRKHPAWVTELMTSHLVYPAPRFSKFVHGVAALFEDYVNHLPFWLSEVETDIRKDPQAAFEEEALRKARLAEDASAIGSFLGAKSSPHFPARSSPIAKSYLSDRMAAESRAGKSSSIAAAAAREEAQGEEDEAEQAPQQQPGGGGYGTISSVIPGFSTKYALSKQRKELPQGVVKPTEWMKNKGELKIEPKVWLANERTFLKWQHICILLGSLSLALYASAGKNFIAEVMGIIYIAIAIFAGVWGYVMLRVRGNMIRERSGKDFDFMAGPLIVSFALMMALILNFYFQWNKAFERLHGEESVAGEASVVAEALNGPSVVEGEQGL